MRDGKRGGVDRIYKPMTKTKAQKESVLNGLLDKFQRMKSAVIVSFSGLKVKDAQKLREQSWQAGVAYEVVKKTLLDLAVKKSGLPDMETKKLQGNIAVAFGLDDEIGAPKLMADFAKGNETVKIVGGILDGRHIDAAAVKSLAGLPGRRELLGRVVGTIAAPMSGMLNVLQGNLRGLVQVLNAMSKQ